MKTWFQSAHVLLASLSEDFGNTIQYPPLMEQSLPITVPHLRRLSSYALTIANG